MYYQFILVLVRPNLALCRVAPSITSTRVLLTLTERFKVLGAREWNVLVPAIKVPLSEHDKAAASRKATGIHA